MDSGDNGDGFRYRKARMPSQTVSAKHHTLLALVWINPYFMRLSRQLAMLITMHRVPTLPSC
jgi:hypothetical protein